MSKGLYVSPTQYVEFADSGRDVRSLSQALATRSRINAGMGLGLLPNPDPILRKQGKAISTYRDLLSDAHVGGCVRRRKSSVKALQWGITRGNASARTSKCIADMFADLDVRGLVGSMLDAVLFGYQPFEIDWAATGRLIVPADIVAKPPEWFAFDEDNQLRFLAQGTGSQGELLPDRKFLLPRQDATYANPYGLADLALVFWPTTFKRGGLKFWLTFTEKYGMPWAVGKHPRNATDEEMESLLDQLESMISDAVAVIPDDASIDIMEASGKASSADIYERLLMFCRAEVSTALLGQNQTTEATSNKASAAVGLEVTDDIRDSDRDVVTAAFNQLVRWIVELNFNDTACPTFEMWAQETVDETQASRDQKLMPSMSASGLRFTPNYYKRSYSLSDDDIERAAPAPASQAGVTDNTDPAFAEADPTAFPDQIAIDGLPATLTAGTLQRQAVQMLQPAVAAIQRGAETSEVLGLLAEAYPAMDASALEQMLSRMLFAAQLWGQLSAQQDLQ